LTFAALATTAALLLTPLAAEETRELPTPRVSVMLVAVRATHQGHEERQFDSSVASIKETVKDLKQFDDFRKLRTLKTVAPYGKDTKIPLDSDYTLILNPIERASHNRIRCNIRVQMRIEEESEKKEEDDSEGETEEPKYKEVLRCTLLAVSDKPFKVGGLKLDEGQLVLVLTLTATNPEQDE
jgi:hypothetical protein